jgi:hypothetical protein
MNRLAAIVIALMLATAGIAVAQGPTSGSIEGHVVDSQGLAVPAAQVTVTSPQGSRTYTTDSEGRFFAPFLEPGVYTVRVELQGFKAYEQKSINVRLGQRVDLPVTMQVGGLQETVEVTGASPVVDTTTATIGATLDSDLLASVPVQRTFTDAIYMAPGVSSSGGVGQANPSISGASGLENQYIVDGVNTTNSGYGAVGSYSIVFGSLGTGIPFDFLKEVQVKSGGFEAEYGQATGGVVNVVTKSGSNNLRGTVFGYIRPEALEGDYTQVVSTAATREESVNFTETQEGDAGVELGGPVLRDRLFFFGAVDPQWERTDLIAPIGLPLRSLGPVSRNRQVTAYAAKGTWQINANHRLDASFFGDPATGDMGPQRRISLTREDTAGFSEIKYGGHNQTVKYDAILTPNWLLEGSFSRSWNNIEEAPAVDSWSVVDRTTAVNLRSGGIGFFEVGNEGENFQYQAKSTHFWMGHQIRYGIVFEDINYNNTIDRTGPSFVLHDGTRTATGAQVDVLSDPSFGRIYRVTRANITNVRETRQEYVSFFVQDTFRIGDRLTIKPGLRYEQQKLVGNLADFKWDNNWQPRIGAVYDPFGDGRTKIFANYGRFYAKIPNDLAARALSADAGVTRADYFDANLTQPVPDGLLAAGQTTHFVTAGLHPADFDPDSKSTYKDEFLAGAEREIMPSLSLGVRYVHRTFGKILEDVGTAPIAAYLLGLPGLESVEYFITNPSPDTATVTDLGARFEEPIHDYDSVEFYADKRFADNWGVQASYRWSRLEGNFEGFYRNDNDQSDPGITSLFDFPTDDPSYTAIAVPQFGARGDIRFLGALGKGPLPLDRPHQFKVFGNYAFDMGLNVGLGMTIGSGVPLTALAANPVYENAGEIPETPRGAGFQTVDGFRERGEIQQEVAVHADYAFRFGGRRLIVLADVFNVFDTQNVVDYDNYTESTFTDPNPDFGTRLAYQLPRRVRFGVRFEF